MVVKQLLDYARQQINAGVSKDVITNALLTTGWPQSDIDEVFSVINAGTASQAPNAPVAPGPSTPTTSQAGASGVMPSIAGQKDILVSTKSRTGFSLLIKAIIPLIFIAVFASVSYAYFQKIGPFAGIPYSESDFLSGLIDKSSKIDSATYALSSSVDVEKRDSDAKPFTIQVSNEEELRGKYQNDLKRAQDVANILRWVGMFGPKNYPSSLQKLVSTASSGKTGLYGQQLSITDPASRNQYSYSVAKDGNDFKLTVAFETSEAVSSIRKSYQYKATSTPINGRFVTFTKNSYWGIYIPQEMPKPLLVQMGESMRILPAEFSIKISAGATSDWSKGSGSDWKFNTDATGSFGDLSYKVNADAIKKDGIYYFRINNMPSLLLGSFSAVKGQWVKVDPAASTTTSGYQYNQLSYISSSFPKFEASYKESSAQFSDLLKKTAQFAGEENLISFRNKPQSEKIEGRTLYKYELKINKESIIPFYKKLSDEVEKNKELPYASLLSDTGLINYLSSKEFDEVFNYYDSNTSITVWVDPKGFPAIIEYSLRVIPPDTAVQLKDKQARIIFRVVFSEINEPAGITSPDEAKDINDLIAETNKNMYEYSPDATIRARDAKRLSDISSLNIALSAYYTDNKQFPGNISALTPKYLINIPKDPVANTPYPYAATGVGSRCTGYHLGAVLEQKSSSYLIEDEDKSVRTVCSGSAKADFDGKTLKCSGVKPEVSDSCYDVWR